MTIYGKDLQISAGEGTNSTVCATCHEGAKDRQVIRLHLTIEMRADKLHTGTIYIHPECLINNLPALWSVNQLLPIIDEVIRPMAEAIKEVK